MIRNLKVLGTAVTIALAMSSVAAGSASAQFEAEVYPTTATVSTSNIQVFTYVAGGIAIECAKVDGDATLPAASASLTMATTFTNCKSAFGPAHLTMNSCHFNFTSAKGSTLVSAHVQCLIAGDSIAATVTDSLGSSVCTLSIPAQTPGGSIAGKNIGIGTTREIEIILNMTGISSTRTGSALCGKASSTAGTYTGIVTVTGEKPGFATHQGMLMD